MNEEERQKLTERLNEVKRQMIYSNTGCEEYLALVKEYLELTEKLGLLFQLIN